MSHAETTPANTRGPRALPSFVVTRDEALLINKIVDRARELYKKYHPDYPAPDALELNMDITACHANGCPLNLEKLLGFPDFDFAHDVFGIQEHLNRRTGGLMDCFLPRCSR